VTRLSDPGLNGVFCIFMKKQSWFFHRLTLQQIVYK
jgi:hypothetical protein